MMRGAFRRSLHMRAAVMLMLTGVAIDGSPASSALTCSRLWLSVVSAICICSMAAENRFRNWASLQKNELRSISPSG
jgi:hypothetical protein